MRKLKDIAKDAEGMSIKDQIAYGMTIGQSMDLKVLTKFKEWRQRRREKKRKKSKY